jgi:hypothetical protein
VWVSVASGARITSLRWNYAERPGRALEGVLLSMTVADQDEAIAALWDSLADFHAGDMATARDHVMAALCGWLKAKNAGWIGGVRTGIEPSDPLLGWRIGAVVYLRDDPLTTKAVADMKALWVKREADPLSVHSVRDAGEKFRAFSLRGAMTPAWFEAPYYQTFFASRDVHDAIIVYFPLNADAESVFIFHGATERGPFAPENIALAARALRGIKWFHRQLMLSHGLLLASAPLSPAERKVLQELLSDATEKTIAKRLDLAPSTVHQYAVQTHLYT